MKIGMILDNEFFGDMRVENEVISLKEAGYEVYLLCFDHKEKDHETSFHGATIVKIHLDKWWKNKMKGLTNFIIDPYTKYWSKRIKSFVEKYKIDVIHVHDLYLLGAALKANASFADKKIVVSDLHENYPAALKHYKFSNTFPGKQLISIPKWYETEKKWTKSADYVITVIEEAVSRYKKIGVSNIRVVANYVYRNIFMSEQSFDKMEGRFDGRFNALYVGGFDQHRGLESAIDAVPEIIKKIPNFTLILVGTGSNLNDLKQQAQELGVAQHISFEGWQNANMLPSYINVSDICLIPHLKTEHTDHTIPHKLFQYMLLKKPVLSTNCNPLERIINETQSGRIYRSNDSKDFAEKIISMFENATERNQMGINGYNAVNDNYNWESTAKNLIALYEEIQSTHFV